jgi:hypothetical protein
MQPEEKLLLICTQTPLPATSQQMVRDLCRQMGIRWDAVYAIAEQHGVAPLIYLNLQQCDLFELGVPSEVISCFKQSFRRTVANKNYIADKLIEILTYFNQRSVAVMLIKGAALDVVAYDQPWYTTFNDVDLVLKLHGADISAQDDTEIKTFFNRFLGFEYEYFKHHDIAMNDVLPVNFERIWNDATRIEFRECEAWVMSPEEMLISVCINSCRKRFFRLKALADISAVIHAYPDLDWSKLIQKAKAYDCTAIVYTALLVAKMTIGCQVPEKVLDRLDVNPVRARIIQFLSQRMSLAAFASLQSGKKLLDRRIDWSLLLPYATFRGYQIWRRIKFVIMFRERGLSRKKPVKKISS